MILIIPLLSLISAFILGCIITNKTSLKTSSFAYLFFAISLGFIIFTAINYYFSLILSFPTGIIVAQFTILFFEIFYIFYHKPLIRPLGYLNDLLKEKLLMILIIVIGGILFILFNHHIIPSINGDLYTGESTYGDLPFHLSTISSIAYGQRFPPDNPMYAGTQLVYPYLINFFSAILVYEGWSLRLAIIIPGLILSLALIGMIYELAFILTKNRLKSFLSVIFYFFNGGLGFYFFLKDYSFNISSIFQALANPTLLKEYSHLFEQNIQWGNFISRMIIPERSLIFGIPAGIIILRLLFFREANKQPSIFDLILTAFLISLMPLLHTHTVLAFMLILPIIGLLTINYQLWKNQLTHYIFISALALIFAIPYIPLFLTHVTESRGFLKFHLWWMTNSNESPIWFWFKNTYLFLPISLLILILPKITTPYVRILQLNAFILLVVINLLLLSPYNWDNVKFLFWAGLFLAIGAGAFFGYLLQIKNLLIKTFTIVVIITMISSALLSIWREAHIKYVLFSNESVNIAKILKSITSPNAIFLTYKIHNSPINNLIGRPIIMGYPGLLWTQGINYNDRDKDVNNIYGGSADAKILIDKYGINYIVAESYAPQEMVINREFLNQFPQLLKSSNYTVYKVK